VRHVAGELPPHDAAAERVDDEREEHQAFPVAQIREIGQPELVRVVGAEVALDEIGASGRGRVRDRGAPRPSAALGALNAVPVFS
jgi:hypothetical protein